MANNNYLNKIRIGSEDVDIHDIRNLAASGTDGGAALKTGAIPFGIVDSTSTSTVFTATVDGITELTDGTCVLLKNGVITSATNFTININGLGAHHAFNNMTEATAETTIFNINYTMLFVYDSTRVVGGITGAWCCYRGYDTNTNTIGYQIRGNYGTRTVTDRARYYKIYFSSADNSQWVPASSNWTNDATAAKAVNQRPIDPFGPIVYTSATTNYTAGSTLTVTTIWQQYALTLGHSFNVSGGALTLTTNAPVYVKCAPQSDGSAIIDSTNPIVQALPTTEDGNIYIFLGFAYGATTIELRMEHPVYYYKGGAIRLWTNTADTTLGTLNTNNTTALTVSSSESFGGTINLHKVSKTGSYNDLLNKPTIPDDSNLVHKTGDETINGDKTFTGDITGSFYGGLYSSHAEFSDLVGILPEASLHIVSDPYNNGEGTDALLIVGNPEGNPEGETPEEQATGGWTQIYNAATDKTLQDELNARNNVQADWNQTTTTAADYIKNKPSIFKNGSNLSITNTSFIEIRNDDQNIEITATDDDIKLNAGGKVYYNNKEIATKNDIPTNVSAFTNDAGYLTSYTETDPTVPAWAKASTKPTYTAAEVGALPDTTVIPDAPGTLNTNNSTAQTVSSSESLSGTINLHKISKTGSYNDLLNKPTIPAVDIALTNSEIDTIWNNVMN